jgi:hypothetical protein
MERFFWFRSASCCKGKTAYAGNFEEGTALHANRALPGQKNVDGLSLKNILNPSYNVGLTRLA